MNAAQQPSPDEAGSADDQPKRWELRAAWRAFERSKDGRNRRNPTQQIVEAAWGLVEEQDDFTVKQVAERAGVALQTLYRHFGSKDELALAMMEDSIGRGALVMADTIGSADPRDQLVGLIEHAIVESPNGPGVDPVLHRRRLQWSARERQRLASRFPHEVEAVHEPFRASVRKALQDGVAAGAVHVDDVGLTAYVIQTMVMSMAHVQASGVLDATPAELAEAIAALAWHGVAAPEDAPGH